MERKVHSYKLRIDVIKELRVIAAQYDLTLSQLVETALVDHLSKKYMSKIKNAIQSKGKLENEKRL